VTIGQLHREGLDLAGTQALGDLMSGALTAPVGIGVEDQVNGACGAVAQLMKLRGIQARA
jgi:hypothetical protein